MPASILDDLLRGIRTTTAEETLLAGQQFAAALPENTVITLRGDLGAGKTTFVQGMARAWNIHQPVTSPTYSIYSIYTGSRQLVHMDAYRLHSGAAAEALMLEEFMRPPWCLVVEWPEKVASWIEDFSPRFDLSLQILADGSHQITRHPATTPFLS